jgi:ParB family transcriptional regulator, chromosome partitioning protein
MPKRRVSSQLGLGDEFDVQLLQKVGGAAAAAEYRHVDPRTIRSSPFQPRTSFTEERIAELADSIREHGLLQPLLVRDTPAGPELLAGERRKRASIAAGLETVTVRFVAADDAAAAAIALAENLHREDLTAWEEAQGLAQLRRVLTVDGKRPTRDRLAEISGRSTGWVSECLFVAERVTEEVIALSGADRHSVTDLPQNALLGIAQEEDDTERARLLALAVESATPGKTVEAAQRRAKAGRPPKPYSLRIHRRGDRAGQVSFRIRSPAEISADAARRILNDLEPVLSALRQRAEGDQG